MPDIEEFLELIWGRVGSIETAVLVACGAIEETNEKLDKILKVLERIEKKGGKK